MQTHVEEFAKLYAGSTVAGSHSVVKDDVAEVQDLLLQLGFPVPGPLGGERVGVGPAIFRRRILQPLMYS